MNLHAIGNDIFNAITKSGWKDRVRSRRIDIQPDQHYRPADVAAFLGVSYDTAVRRMRSMGASNLGTKGRRYKRGKSLLVVSGKRLLSYLKNREIET